MRLPLLLAPLLLAAACSVPVNTPDDPQIPAIEGEPAVGVGSTRPGAPDAAEADPAASLRERLTGPTWTWVRTEEPATGEVMAPTEGAAEHVFTFMPNGRFVEDQLGGCCRREGSWSLSDKTLALDYEEGGSGTWTDVSVSGDQLVWKQLGRHGELINVYRPR